MQGHIAGGAVDSRISIVRGFLNSLSRFAARRSPLTPTSLTRALPRTGIGTEPGVSRRATCRPNGRRSVSREVGRSGLHHGRRRGDRDQRHHRVHPTRRGAHRTDPPPLGKLSIVYRPMRNMGLLLSGVTEDGQENSGSCRWPACAGHSDALPRRAGCYHRTIRACCSSGTRGRCPLASPRIAFAIARSSARPHVGPGPDQHAHTPGSRTVSGHHSHDARSSSHDVEQPARC